MEKETLIAYFKRKGEAGSQSARVAKSISDALASGGIAHREYVIEPTEIYPADSAELMDVAVREKKDKMRPALINRCGDMKQVDKIVLIGPNWLNDYPMGVYTFLDTYDLKGDKLIPVVLHAGDGGIEIVKSLRHYLYQVDVADAIEVADGEIGEDALRKLLSELQKG